MQKKWALGITQVKQQVSRKTGIPSSAAGLERKIVAGVLGVMRMILKRKKRLFVISESFIWHFIHKSRQFIHLCEICLVVKR